MSFETNTINATKSLDQAQAKLKQGAEKSVQQTEQMVRFSQDNIEALTKSTQIWTTGVQSLSQQIAASFQASAKEGMDMFKTLAATKSVREAIELQSNFARHALNRAMSESARLTEASVNLSLNALTPITQRAAASATVLKNVA